MANRADRAAGHAAGMQVDALPHPECRSDGSIHLIVASINVQVAGFPHGRPENR
jgi:hypothetical protein